MKYLLLLLIPLLSGCVSTSDSDFNSLEGKTAETVKKLEADPDFHKLMDSVKISDKSYFYILSTEGRVKYHPEKALKGNDFSRYGFVRKIMAVKNGCISINAGNISRIIIFRAAANGDILCLTAPSEGAAGSEKCNIYKEEEAR